MEQAKVTDTTFRNIKAAQQAYVASYNRQAAIAGQTADALGAMEPAFIADGRIDTKAALAGWHLLNVLLTGGAQSIANLTPKTTADIEAVITNNNEQLEKQHYRPADMGQLTPEETAFVGTMPGCEGLVAPS